MSNNYNDESLDAALADLEDIVESWEEKGVPSGFHYESAKQDNLLKREVVGTR